jgi:hypothetical protein
MNQVGLFIEMIRIWIIPVMLWAWVAKVVRTCVTRVALPNSDTQATGTFCLNGLTVSKHVKCKDIQKYWVTIQCIQQRSHATRNLNPQKSRTSPKSSLRSDIARPRQRNKAVTFAHKKTVTHCYLSTDERIMKSVAIHATIFEHVERKDIKISWGTFMALYWRRIRFDGARLTISEMLRRRSLDIDGFRDAKEKAQRYGAFASEGSVELEELPHDGNLIEGVDENPLGSQPDQHPCCISDSPSPRRSPRIAMLPKVNYGETKSTRSTRTKLRRSSRLARLERFNYAFPSLARLGQSRL